MPSTIQFEIITSNDQWTFSIETLVRRRRIPQGFGAIVQ